MIWLPQRHPGIVSLVGILPFFRSDHSYVYLEINLQSGLDRGKGLWKFNTSHLKDETFCNKIAAFWVEWIKRLIRHFSREKSQQQQHKIKSLNATVKHIQRRINNSEQLPGLMEEVRAELASELLSEAKGAQLHAATWWAEDRESSTAYFLHQEKVQGQQRLISGVKCPDGMLATSTKDTIGVWRDYYFKLFSSDHLVSSIGNINKGHSKNEVIPDLSTNDPPDPYAEPPPSSFLHQDDEDIEAPNPDLNKE